MGTKTKIDWCDATWNPVTGCLHGCEYCYARGIANRFGLPYAPKLGDPGMEGAKKYDSVEGMDTMLELAKPYEANGRKQPYPMGFLPTFHRYKLEEPQHWRKPRNIFVCSMADLFGEWVPDWWIEAVLNACAAAPQHRYLFLTKNPGRYLTMPLQVIRPNGVDFWYGFTATGVEHIGKKRIVGLKAFLSIEPLMCKPTQYMLDAITGVTWVIIGAETGNRKGKIVPEKEWIMRLVEHAERHYTYVFIKESLRDIMGSDFRQEFPWEVR